MHKADLHMHSTFSDGSCSIEEIVEIAKKRNLDAIAITDHDTFEHLEYLKTKEFSGLDVIGGIEVSCFDFENNQKVHILLFNVEYNEELDLIFQKIYNDRLEVVKLSMKALIEHGYNIDGIKDKHFIYKQLIMSELIKNGYCDDIYGDLYNKLFKNNGICSFEIEYPDVYQVLRIAKNTNTTPVLAHPNLYNSIPIIPSLVEFGLKGVEVSYKGAVENELDDYIMQFDLLEFGGSDFHGNYGKTDIADYYCNANVLTKIEEK